MMKQDRTRERTNKILAINKYQFFDEFLSCFKGPNKEGNYSSSPSAWLTLEELGKHWFFFTAPNAFLMLLFKTEPLSGTSLGCPPPPLFCLWGGGGGGP